MAFLMEGKSQYTGETKPDRYKRVDTFTFSRSQQVMLIQVMTYESKKAFQAGAAPIHSETFSVSSQQDAVRDPATGAVVKDKDGKEVLLPTFADLVAANKKEFDMVVKLVYTFLKTLPAFASATSDE